MLWLDDDVIAHHVGDCIGASPHWQHMRREVENLGDLLRAHLPNCVEPPDPLAFNSQVQQRLGKLGCRRP